LLGFSNTYWIHKTAIMGRWYEGDINGKFWFGVQDTSSIEKYGGEVEQDFEWNGCRCCAEEDCEDDYCDCYDSYEAHKEDLDGEEPEVQESGDVKLSITKAKFEEIAVPWLQSNEDLKQYIKEIVYKEEGGYDIILGNTPIRISYEKLETEEVSVGSEIEVKLADYCLLKQIEQYFERNPNETICGFMGEL